jgi:osmoprotectant transport system permease protein
VIDYVENNTSVIWEALQEHLLLSLVPVVMGLIISLPIGYFAVRYRWAYHPLINLSSTLYAVPSLALFVTLPALLGTQILNPVNIIVALTVYTVALMVRTVADGLNSVDSIVTQAATALGYRRLRRLFRVELPLAVPVIAAGLRIATVSNISLVSVGALIGVGGLGALFTQGLQLNYLAPILVGMILSAGLAAACDLTIVFAQRKLTPWVNKGAAR